MNFHQRLLDGVVIPAHPLALTPGRKLDERRQRALTRYYKAAGAGGVAVGVHTTQFAIRRPEIGLYRPVLELAAGELAGSDLVRVAGVVGPAAQAVREAGLARDLGYQVALLSLAGLDGHTVPQLVDHVRAVAEVMPVMGFYLQPAVGGRLLPVDFWRGFASIPGVVAVKIAPFNRYQTLDVIRAVAESGREDLALYTGNDDTIVSDLMSPYRFSGRIMRIRGGLLGHWAVWTERAVAMHRGTQQQEPSAEWLRLAAAVTDCNAAFFDAANGFRGCIAGLHEVLRRQGLLAGRWCLDPDEDLSPGQMEEIDRVYGEYPDLNDDDFIRANLDRWLAA
ncbi:MAG: dihydrodipicolinate synthase family protein [Acidobacteria bacterium]|nr:dihydrodipicolinate synthase family protein [Acidobacteriota bacterium]